jgi:hypothetical protein
MRTRRRTYAQIVDARQWHVSLQRDDGGIEWTLEEIGRLSCSAVTAKARPLQAIGLDRHRPFKAVGPAPNVG